MTGSTSLRRGVLQSLVGNVTVMALSVAIGALSARMLGVEGRGELAAIQLVPHVVFMLAVLGVHEAVVFHVARQDHSTAGIFGSALAITAPLALIGLLASAMVVPLVLHRFDPAVRSAAQVYSVFIVLALVHGVMLRILQGRALFGWWNTFRVVLQAGSLVVLLVLWAAGRLTAITFCYGILVLNVVVLAITVLLFRRKGLLEARVEAPATRSLWSYSWRAGVGTVPQLLNLRLDQLLIAAMLSSHALGLYSTAVSWSTGFLPLASAYGSVLFPSVARHADEQAAESFARAMRRGLVFMVGIWLAYLAITPVAFRLIYGPEFAEAMPSVLLLVGASLFLSLNQMLTEGVKGLGRPILASVAELIGLGVTTVLLLALIGRWQILGAALASLGAYLVTSAVLLTGLLREGSLHWRDLMLPRAEEWVAWRRQLGWERLGRLP